MNDVKTIINITDFYEEIIEDLEIRLKSTENLVVKLLKECNKNYSKNMKNTEFTSKIKELYNRIFCNFCNEYVDFRCFQEADKNNNDMFIEFICNICDSIIAEVKDKRE